MSKLKPQSTTITEASDGMRVRVLFADDPDSDAASETVLIDLPVQIPEGRPLREYRAEALARARRAIDEEIVEIERLHKPFHK